MVGQVSKQRLSLRTIAIFTATQCSGCTLVALSLDPLSGFFLGGPRIRFFRGQLLVEVVGLVITIGVAFYLAVVVTAIAFFVAHVFRKDFFPDGLYEVLGNASNHGSVISFVVLLPVYVVVLHAFFCFMVRPMVAD